MGMRIGQPELLNGAAYSLVGAGIATGVSCFASGQHRGVMFVIGSVCVLIGLLLLLVVSRLGERKKEQDEELDDRRLLVCPSCNHAVPKWSLGRKTSDGKVLDHKQGVVCNGHCSIYPHLNKKLGESPLEYWRRAYATIGKKLPDNIQPFKGEE